MTRAVWLRLSALFIALIGNFNNYGALPFQKDKPTEPKDFVTKNSKPLQQSPTRPISLSYPGHNSAFNALIQVLWVLEPFNDMMRKEKQLYHFNEAIRTSYLASIDAKNMLTDPLSLKPFIERMNVIAKKQLVNPAEILNTFIISLSGYTHDLFIINYYRLIHCIRGRGDKHSAPREERITGQPKYLSVNVTEQSKNLREALIAGEKIDKKCKCGQNLVSSLIPIPNLPNILIIYTNRGQDTKKNKIPYTFPLFNLKFGKQLYDLVGVIFNSGEVKEAKYYTWIEYYGRWYKCNNEEIKSFMEIRKEAQENTTIVKENFVTPLTQTELLIYLKKPIIQQIRIAHSKTFRKEIQKSQRLVAHNVWKQKEPNIDKCVKGINPIIKNLPDLIEKKFKKQWDPVFQGMLDA